MHKKKLCAIQKIKTKLAEQAKNKDYEVAHYNADALLCELLIAFNLKEVVEIYEKVGKWYA